MTIRKVLFTRDAVIAMLADEPTCDTCRGRGRIEVQNARDVRTCPSCRGAGVPARVAYAHTMARTEHKAAREVRA
jgi:DnaJ-class molecular chaperone